MYLYPVLAFMLGLAVYFAPVDLPGKWASYLSLALLAGLDAITGGVRARLQGNFEDSIFLSGFFCNALLAAGLAYIGDLLRIDLFLAALIVLGGRIFLNLSIIRVEFIKGRRAPKKNP
ncbi:MAG: small basic family protein [Abditibacteriota bacterium]|nr:small basic family protein [Abditibacteriota bacterium]